MRFAFLPEEGSFLGPECRRRALGDCPFAPIIVS
jgi:hypothetical protein